MSNVYETVVPIIAKQLRVEQADVTLEAKLVEDLMADSANIMVLIMDLEDKYGIMVEDEVIGKLKTVGDVVDYIEKSQS